MSSETFLSRPRGDNHWERGRCAIVLHISQPGIDEPPQDCGTIAAVPLALSVEILATLRAVGVVESQIYRVSHIADTSQ
jgi:hypothetical protein